MIFVTGRTFEHARMLGVTMGGRWNRDAKRWEFISLMQEHLDWLARTPGIIVTDRPELVDHTTPIPQRPGFAGTQMVHNADKQWKGYFADPNPAVHFGFSNLGSMIDYIQRIPKEIQNDKRRNDAWDDLGDFRGTVSMDEALNLARNGWPAGIELAERIIERLTGDNAIERRRKYNVAGGSVNVGRMLSGNPAHMINRPKQPGSKIVTFFAEVGMAATINSDDAAIRSAVVAANCDVLEANGFQCEIVAVDTTTNGYDHDAICYITTTLKQAGEPLNLNDVVFGLGHPSFCRRLCFAVMASNNKLIDVCNNGYGHPGDAFTKEHPTKPNEFYLKRLEKKYEGGLMQRAFAIWDDINDKRLPITINRS